MFVVFFMVLNWCWCTSKASNAWPKESLRRKQWKIQKKTPSKFHLGQEGHGSSCWHLWLPPSTIFNPSQSAEESQGLIPPCPIISLHFLKGQETQFCSVLLHLTVIFSRTKWFTLRSDSIPRCSWAKKWLGGPKARYCEFNFWFWFCSVLAVWPCEKLFQFDCLSSFFSKMGMAKEPTTWDYCED